MKTPLTFDVTMRGVKGDKISATLTIEIGKGSSTGTKVKGDIIYEVDPDDSVTFDRTTLGFPDDETGDIWSMYDSPTPMDWTTGASCTATTTMMTGRTLTRATWTTVISTTTARTCSTTRTSPWMT